MPRTDGECDYSCFGLRLRSQIGLPELNAVAMSSGDAGDSRVEIKTGDVPFNLPRLTAGGGDFQVGEHEILLRVPGIARYRIRSGREITVDMAPQAATADVRLFLLGSAFGILCHQRGLLPLHANAVVMGGGAVAFAGDSGAGKSTLAAHFQRAGYAVLGDDVCVVSLDDAGRPLAWPGPPRLKLWRDAAACFGHDVAGLQRAEHGQEKYHVPFAQRSGAGPFPLLRLYMLEAVDPGATADIRAIQGAAAYEAIFMQTYRRQFLAPMGLRKRHLGQSAALLRHAKVYRAPRIWGFDVFAREAAKLERHFQGH